MTTGFDIGGVTGRPVRPTDNAYGFQEGLVTTDGIRESTWQDALELAGLYVQYSTDGSTWSDTSSASDTHFRVAPGTEKPSDSSSRWSAGIALGGEQPDITGLVDDVTFNDPTVTVTYQDGTTSTFDLPDAGLSTVETQDPVEGDGSIATPVTLTDTAKHSLSQVPALEERTQDLAIEDTYVWADTTDGVISLRSDAPPAPWLQTTIWGATYSYSSQDAGANNTYIVLRIGNSEEVNQLRIEVTKGSNTFYYNGAAFKRIHKSETTHKYYAHPHSNLQSGDELQVQKGTVTGEVTEYRGHVGGAAFTPPDGTGNLADTVDTVDELVTAVDELSLGSEAGSGYAFSATLADIADIASGTAFANLTSGLTAGELINEGSVFSVETVAGRDKLVLANAGTYSVTASLIGSADVVATGVDRGTFRARIARERSSVITPLAPEGTPTYARNQYEDFSQRLGSAVSGVYAFEAGDKIEIQGLYEGQGTSTVNFNLVGARSGISIVAVGAGPKGDPGLPGTGAVTNLAIASRDADSLQITSDTGTDATVPSASATEAGLESAADKAKLDGVATGATAVSTQAIQAIVNATSLSALQGMVTDSQIPDAIMRDAELTAAAIETLLGLTSTEVNDLLTGASITGQILTFTQNDGTTVAVTIPTAMAGTGDGVVQSGAFNADQTELILTLDTGGVVTIDVPAALRGTGDGTVLNGNGAPAGNSGKNGDTYRDDESGAWYKKASGAWSAALYTPTAAGISLAADFPIVADAVAGTWYGDGTPTPEAVGFLGTLGETHVSAFRTAYLGHGFYGFASAAGSAGPTFKKGGDVAPLPEGLLTLAFHVSSLTSNGLFVDVDTAAGLFMAELTSDRGLNHPGRHGGSNVSA